jgi:hypothetical protein
MELATGRFRAEVGTCSSVLLLPSPLVPNSKNSGRSL